MRAIQVPISSGPTIDGNGISDAKKISGITELILENGPRLSESGITNVKNTSQDSNIKVDLDKAPTLLKSSIYHSNDAQKYYEEYDSNF